MVRAATGCRYVRLVLDLAIVIRHGRQREGEHHRSVPSAATRTGFRRVVGRSGRQWLVICSEDLTGLGYVAGVTSLGIRLVCAGACRVAGSDWHGLLRSRYAEVSASGGRTRSVWPGELMAPISWAFEGCCRDGCVGALVHTPQEFGCLRVDRDAGGAGRGGRCGRLGFQ